MKVMPLTLRRHCAFRGSILTLKPGCTTTALGTTTQDPISLAGGINLYQYAPNPVQWADLLGLHPLDNTELGKKLISNSSRTGKNFQGQQIYKIDNKVTIDGIKFKKGDYYYLDVLHKDHVEAFSSNN